MTPAMLFRQVMKRLVMPSAMGKVDSHTKAYSRGGAPPIAAPPATFVRYSNPSENSDSFFHYGMNVR